MIRVKFDDPDEFLTELFEYKCHISADIVRVTQSRPAGTQRLYVYAGAIVSYQADAALPYTFDCLVELECCAGEAPDRQTQAKADGLVKRLENEICGMQLKVRAGVYDVGAGHDGCGR